MLDYLLIDFTGMSMLPETMLYTADYLSQTTGSEDIRILKISDKKQYHEMLLEGFKEIGEGTVVLMWQQEWIRPRTLSCS